MDDVPGGFAISRRDALRRFLRGAVGFGVLGSASLSCRKRRYRLIVGFSQMANSGVWRVAETASMRQAAAAFAEPCELVVTDAQDQTAKQISDVEDLIARRVAAIFLAPREYEGLAPALEAARRAAIPVFLIDREAEGQPGEDYVAFVGSDFVAQGRRAAEWLAQALRGAGRIIELQGTAGSSVARDRAAGFREGLTRHPRMHIIGSQTADFARSVALRVMENVIQAAGRELSAVYSHNDEMALGAISALRSAGRRPGRDVTVVSIDGQRSALAAILAGELGASIESNPRLGPLAFGALARLRAGLPVEKRILIEDRLFDAKNAARFISEAY